MFVKNKQIRKRKPRSRQGITIAEMMLASAIAVIAMVSISSTLSDSHHGFRAMYNRVYSDVVTDSQVARRMFDSVVRKSNCYEFTLDLDYGRWVEVHYYADSSSVVPDRYACFNWDDTHLYVEDGRILGGGLKETLDYRAICGNVESCTFKRTGRSLQMFLTLDNGSQEMTTVTSAVMHN